MEREEKIEIVRSSKIRMEKLKKISRTNKRRCWNFDIIIEIRIRYGFQIISQVSIL